MPAQTPFNYRDNFSASKEEHLDAWYKISGESPITQLRTNASLGLTQEDVNDIKPIDVIIAAMNQALLENDLKKAVFFAEKALPYTAPRLSAVASTLNVKQETPLNLDGLSLDELQVLHRLAIDQQGTPATRH